MTDQKSYYRVYAIAALRNFMFDCYDSHERVMDRIYRLIAEKSIDSSVTWVIERHEKADVVCSNVVISYGVYVDDDLMDEVETMGTALHRLNGYALVMDTCTRFSIEKTTKINKIKE